MRSLRRHPAESSLGALRPLGFGLSASVPMLHPRRLPSRLTSRSSRRRVVASLKLLGMRAILAPNRSVRRGLTPALGGIKAVCSCVDRNCDSSASAGIALRTILGHVASSVMSARRAHTSHASRCQASEARVFICRFPASDPRLRTRPAEGSQGALNLPVFGFRSARPQFGVAGFRPA